MAFKFPTLERKSLSGKLINDLPSFTFENVQETEVIGHGAYGVVFKGKFGKDTVVAKKLLGESMDEEDCFIKEAKLLNFVKHENIVLFKGFCSSPYAIMMEYLCFDFSPFELSKRVSNLLDFLNFMDKIDGFGCFEDNFLLRIGQDISNGLEYLHSKDIAHRDLKTKNILVSNQHYCHLPDEERMQIFTEKPIICKLADFGESRSQQIQTAIVHSTTRRIDRGTPVYMAPEILVKSSRLKSARFNDLKKVDVWALGMVMFNLVNPNLKYPFQLDLEDGTSTTEQIQEFLRLGKPPSGSPKYKKFQETKWLPITEIKKKCTDVDPIKRPTAFEIKKEFQALLLSNIADHVEHTENRMGNQDENLSTGKKKEGKENDIPVVDLTCNKSPDSVRSQEPSNNVRTEGAEEPSRRVWDVDNSCTDSSGSRKTLNTERSPERKKKRRATDTAKITYYNGNLLLPIFSTKRNILSPLEVVRILHNVGKDVSSAFVCTRQPFRVEHHRTFIVDLESFKSREDIKCDDVGSWQNNSCNKYQFTNNGVDWVQLEKEDVDNTADEIVKLKREYFKLRDDGGDFRRRIDTVLLPDGQPYRYCLVQYSFKGGNEHSITPRQHGNTTTSTGKPYVRTWSSTKAAMKSASKELNPREVVYKVVTDELGGVASCSSVGQLPRNRQQVKDLAKVQKSDSCMKNLSSNNEHDDPWYRLLGESKKQAADRKTAFIRDVRVAPEPLCIMTTDRQLNDLKRFCCNPVEYRPFTVDPTFNIGKYNVTPITYQHLLLENKRDGNHPSLIGPVLLHEKKTTETYSTFAGALKTLEPSLRDIMAFGTDDEKALVEGFKNNFDRSVHLLCELHLKKNIEKKLQEMGIVGEIKSSIVADIFGKSTGSVQESGLTDAQDGEKFENMLLNLKEKWSTIHKNGTAFHKWFVARKTHEFLTSVIAPVRQIAGLGCPPQRFTTNRSEQTNRLIQEFVKTECNAKKNLDEFSFCVSLAKLVNTQNQEVELAMVGMGEYKLREKFKFIEVSGGKWSGMQEEQKKKAVEKVHTTTLEEQSPSSARNISRFIDAREDPLMQEMFRGGVDWVPREILSTMVTKAIALTSTPGAITYQSTDTVVVASSSNPRRPHIVNMFANGKTECANCPGFTSSSLCKHTIAVSVKLGRMERFIRWLVSSKRSKGGINYSKSITYGMPPGRGRKGNHAPRKKGKSANQSTTAVIPRVSDVLPDSPESTQMCIPLSTPANIQPPPTVQPTSAPYQQPHFTYQMAPISHNQLGEVPPRMSSNPTLSSEPFPPTTFGSQPVGLMPQQPSVYPPMAHIPTSQRITHTHSQAHNVAFPNPHPDQFMVYLLQYCPTKTSMCFGCGNPLKMNETIPAVPQDLVIVSKMMREWSYKGTAHSKLANVYFHCDISCVQRKKPDFNGHFCTIAPDIEPYLQLTHRQHLRDNIGL